VNRNQPEAGRSRRRIWQSAEVVETRGQDPAQVGRVIESWLKARGFDPVAFAAERRYLITAEATMGWKKTIGVSPTLEIELSPAHNGVLVDIHVGRASGDVWLARTVSYGTLWALGGMSFVGLRSELLAYLRQTHDLTSNDLPRIDVVEATRVEQPLGSEERTIDNSHADSAVTRTLRATRRWTQTWQLDFEKSRNTGKDIGVNLAQLASFRGNMDRTLRERYSTSASLEQAFEEEVTLTIPPRTALCLILNWKTIVQEGYLRVHDADGAEVPFAIAVGLTFDQRQVDVTPGDITSEPRAAPSP
jgi:hypothetical protein